MTTKEASPMPEVPQGREFAGSLGSAFSFGNRGQTLKNENPHNVQGHRELFETSKKSGVSVIVSNTATIEAIRAAALHLQNLHAEITMTKEGKRREYEESIMKGEFRCA